MLSNSIYLPRLCSGALIAVVDFTSTIHWPGCQKGSPRKCIRRVLDICTPCCKSSNNTQLRYKAETDRKMTLICDSRVLSTEWTKFQPESFFSSAGRGIDSHRASTR